MYSLYRWWDRYRIQLLLALLSLVAAASLRQTEGAGVLELYRLIALPFQGNPTQQERLVNARTWELQQRLTELEIQNQKLQDLIGQPVVTQGKGVIASVIGRSADHWWQQMSLGRGRQDGLQVGSVVVAPGGLVGRVTNTSKHTSRVLLISDPTSRIGVTVTRSRRMGILQGQAGDWAVLEFPEKDPDVRPGDVIVTSSLSSLFPAGLLVGRVESVNLTKTSSPHAAVVKLSAPVSDVEWVTVYLDDKISESRVSASP
ncbi:MAG TPA: rod shape-determining protein MreC [Candidatus Caenarcaniphilales bacterium]